MKKRLIQQAIYWTKRWEETGSVRYEDLSTAYLRIMIMSNWSMPEYTVSPAYSFCSMSFNGAIRYKNEPVLRIENTGQGEADRITPIVPENREHLLLFLSDVSDWVKAYGVLDLSPESVWAMWCLSGGAMGKTEAEFFEAYKKQFPDSVSGEGLELIKGRK